MQVTDVKVKIVENDVVKARISVTFDNVFVVHNLRLIEGAKGLFVSMPSIKSQKGGYLEMAHPISKKFRDELNAKITEAYSNAVEIKKNKE